MQAKYVNILIHRGMAETIPATVFEHELDVLRDIHGQVDLADEQVDRVVEIDPDEEFDRLKNKYGMNDAGQFYAERVFGVSAKAIEAYAHKPKRSKAVVAEAE